MTLPQAGWRSRASAARAVNRQSWTGAGAAAVDPDHGATAAPIGYAAPSLAPDLAPAKPFVGVKWTLSLLGLTGYEWVVHQGVSPLGEVFLILALFGVIIQKQPLRLPPELMLLLAFAGVGLVTSGGSMFPDIAFQGAVNMFKLAIIMFIFCNAIRTREQFRAVILIFLFMYALYPMRGAMFNYIFGINTQGRFAWNFIFSNPNDLAGFCLMPMALTAGLLKTERKGWIWYGALLQMLALFFIVLITQSRGAIIAAFLLAFSMLVASRPKARTIGMLALAFIAVLPLVPAKTWERMSGLSRISLDDDMAGVDAEGSAEGRYAVWQVARAIFRDNAVVGVGIGVYSRVHRLYARNTAAKSLAMGARDTHSTYLNTLAENGLVGFGLLGTLWLIALMRAQRAITALRAWSPMIALQLRFMQLGFIAFLVAAIWATFEHLAFMYVYVSLIFVLSELYLGTMRADQSARRRPA